MQDDIRIIGTDCLQPENYAGIFMAPREEIRRHHVREVFWDYGSGNVYVPSPEFLFASKTAIPMRQKDIHDVNALRETLNLDAALYERLTVKRLS